MLNAITLIIFSNDEYLNLRKLNLNDVDDEKLNKFSWTKLISLEININKKIQEHNCSWIFYYFEIICIT